MLKINPEHETETIVLAMRKTSDQYTEYFNQEKFVKKKVKQISPVDFYQAIKSKDKSLAAIKKDLHESVIIFSDRINYKDNLMAEVIHDYHSKLVKEKITEVKVPIYEWKEIKEDEETEKALQVIYGTQDSISEIVKVLKEFSGNKKLYLYTPDANSRKAYPLRSFGCGFDWGGSELNLGCDGRPGYSYWDGRSFGVRVINQKPKASKKKVI